MAAINKQISILVLVSKYFCNIVYVCVYTALSAERKWRNLLLKGRTFFVALGDATAQSALKTTEAECQRYVTDHKLKLAD